MLRTNKIGTAGTIKGATSVQLSEILKPFLDKYFVSRNKYKMLLNDDGDNLYISFNDKSGFDIFFQLDDEPETYLVTASNTDEDIKAIPILQAVLTHLQTQNLAYKIEIQYQYENGEWKDEDFLTNPL